MKFILVFFFVFLKNSYCDIFPRLDGKIVGGEKVSINEYPYQVSIRINDQHICGGTIISKNTVLTAAHCVYGMEQAYYSVRVGSTIHSIGTSIRVSQIIQHPYYDPKKYRYDMAVLKLASTLKFSSRIQAVPLQPFGVEVPAGTKSWVSGWGVTFEGGEQIPEVLRAVDVAVVDNYECSQKYAPGEITVQMMCAQTYNQDSCQGDSGGPLVANGRLIGVVSWGYGCARPEYPGVYAKVSHMYQWIIANSY